jgi:uncharacterized membrane protein HdeD (DUF308 family)
MCDGKTGHQRFMYIGLGIVLLVLGLILAFDVITVDLSFINDQALGVILIVCGILAIVLSFLWARPRRTAATDRTVVYRDNGPV